MTPRLLLTATLCLAVVAAAGCDRSDSSNTASTPPTATVAPAPPRPAPPVPTEAERYAEYKQKIQPVVDELVGVESLIEHPNTLNFGDVDTRVKAMNLAFTKLTPQLIEDDKARPSYKEMQSAMDNVVKAHGCWQEAGRARERINAGELRMPNGLFALSVAQKGDEYTNKFLVDAEVDIVGMNGDLAKSK